MLAVLSDTAADVIAIIAGGISVVSLVAGVWLALHAARSKERQAYHGEIEQLRIMLEDERNIRIALELERHRLKLKMAELGIDPDNGHG
jgi:hypothetical protein